MIDFLLILFGGLVMNFYLYISIRAGCSTKAYQKYQETHSLKERLLWIGILEFMKDHPSKKKHNQQKLAKLYCLFYYLNFFFTVLFLWGLISSFQKDQILIRYGIYWFATMGILMMILSNTSNGKKSKKKKHYIHNR